MLFILFSYYLVILHCKELQDHYNNWIFSSSKINEFENGTPKLALSYLHMRKASGTLFLDFMKGWMNYYGCSGSDVPPNWTLFHGVQNGNILGHNLNSSKCYSFDFIHEEFSCLNGQAMTKIIPRSNRLHIPMKLFTIIRHPIERICAQAFYSENSVGYSTIHEIMVKNCLAEGEKRKIIILYEIQKCERNKNNKNFDGKNFCECLYNSSFEGFETLKSNSTLWFEWFNSLQTFGDTYMPNYYVKRLLTGYSSNHVQQISIANDCIENQRTNCSGLPLLNYFTPKTRCLTIPLLNSSLTLRYAKHLLENQFEFFLVEKYNDPKTPYFFGSLLNESNITLIENLLSSSIARPGIVTLLSSKKSLNNSSTNSTFHYRSLLPDTVLEFLYQDNHEDIQLFHFAIKLYHKRITEIINSQKFLRI